MDIGIVSRVIGNIQHHVKPVSNFFVLVYYRIFKTREFQFKGEKYFYLYSLHNETFRNERSVEIPIVMKYMIQYKGRKILEVGNVLSHYFYGVHKIIDKYEKGASILNYDITEYHPNEKFDLIVTISTLEHVGWDEYSRYGDESTNEKNNPKLLLKAIAVLKEMLNEGGIMIATMPLGFNSYLDSLIKDGNLGFSEISFLKRISKDNEWREVTYDDVKNIKYSDPYPCANALMVGMFQSK